MHQCQTTAKPVQWQCQWQEAGETRRARRVRDKSCVPVAGKGSEGRGEKERREAQRGWGQ
eukprot:6475792-Prorocentrum_lima.AAC.1